MNYLIKHIASIVETFINAGFTENEHGLFLVSKVRMYNLVASIAVLAAFSLGLFAFTQNFLMLGVVDLVFAFLTSLQIYYLRITKKYENVATAGAVFVGVFYLYLLFSGGVNNTASLWLYTYPLIVFALYSLKKALYSNVIFFVLIILFFIFQHDLNYATKYSTDYILRYIPSYLVVAIYSYLYAAMREKTFQMLSDKNYKLEKIVAELEEKKECLTQLSKDLEKRVNERTVELLEAKKEAETSEKIKTEFLAQMSHEIRSPLNVVMNFIELIKSEVEDTISEEMKYSFQSIDSASTRIIRTIDLILNMTDLQLGSYEVLVGKIDVVEMFNRVKSEYLQTAKIKNLELLLEVDFDSKVITSDEYALVQVISNLVDNAIKYTSSGFVKIEARSDEMNNLVVEIIDSGIGMSEEFLPTLFHSFTQEEQGYSRAYDGNGLGMALVKNYCELISTEISVTSKKGMGSKFTLKIPNL